MNIASLLIFENSLSSEGIKILDEDSGASLKLTLLNKSKFMKL